jgi:F0F1-type ATP synthase delta subunit
MKDTYVHAILELIQSGQTIDTVLLNLTKVLASRGHCKLHGAILHDLLAKLELVQETSLPKVVLAKEGSVSEAEIKFALQKLNAPDTNYTVTVNPNIIGGLIATYQSKQLDQSYQTKLRELFKSIITA